MRTGPDLYSGDDSATAFLRISKRSSLIACSCNDLHRFDGAAVNEAVEDNFVFIKKFIEFGYILFFEFVSVVGFEGFDYFGYPVGDVTMGGFHLVGEVEIEHHAVDDGFEEGGFKIEGMGFAEEDTVDEDFEGEPAGGGDAGDGEEFNILLEKSSCITLNFSRN